MRDEAIRILVVDDEPDVCETLSSVIENEGMTPLLVPDAKTALDRIRLESPDLLVTDFWLPDLDGLELLQRAKNLDDKLPVVIITGQPDLHKAVEAMKASAFDYLAKPIRAREFVQVLRAGLAERGRRLKQLSGHISATPHLVEMMGPSETVCDLIAQVNRVSKSNFSVIITGETGSGKEVVARAIHDASTRKNGSFIPIDCGAVPEALFEAELFGHEKGAFTGAMNQKRGRFELASGGTLFLDEILNMPFSSQTKVLRAIQERVISRIGGTQPVPIDVRILAAGNHDFGAAIAAGKFREDLFYRLNEFTIVVPPLRKRKQDIGYLGHRFLEQTNHELKKAVKGFTESALEALLAFSWPGNVRQLRSTIRRAVLLSDDRISEAHLDIAHAENGFTSCLCLTAKLEEMPTENFSLKEIVAKNTSVVEREAVLQALLRTGGNKAKAARTLRIDYKTMQTKVKRYGINLNQE